MGKQLKFGGEFLEAISPKPAKRKRFCVYDIESKDGSSKTKPGFTRPFVVGFYDPNRMHVNAEKRMDGEDAGYWEFRDEPHLMARPCDCRKRRDPEKPDECVCWSDRHILPGGCIDKLMNLVLCKRYKNYLFYAHNGGNFDHLFLLTWLERHRDEFDFEVVPIQSTIQVIRIWKKPEDPKAEIKERWEFLDSIKLMPMSLDKACEAFDLPGKVEQDLGMHEDNPAWSVYLKQDCIALCTVLTLFYDMVENKLGGEVGITTPSTAMKLFRKQFLGKDGCPSRIPRWRHWEECPWNGQNDIVPDGYIGDVCHGCMHDWIRRGYYGGRTEIHRMHGRDLHYYDINSSYVAAMRSQMPIGDRVVQEGVLDWRFYENWNELPDEIRPKANAEKGTSWGGYSGFCECRVFIPTGCKVPPLPHRSVETGKLVFPTGVFNGVWSVEELALLFDPLVNGKILKVKKTVWFELRPMFQQMVDQLWKLRDENLPEFNKGLSMLAKLLGNSTYGKFAMKRERSSVVFRRHIEPGEKRCFLCGKETMNAICKDCEGSKPAGTDPEGVVWYQNHSVDASYIIPHVASHITALARRCLWNAMATVVRLGGNVYYSDTDSVVTDVELPCSKNLGDLKDEYPGELLEYLAVQPKVYLIKKQIFNADVARRKDVMRLAAANDGYDASVLDRDADLQEGVPDAKAKKRRRKKLEVGTSVIDPSSRSAVLSNATYDVHTRYDASALGDAYVPVGGGFALQENAKVTMKGFPPRVRTEENLATLRAGGIIQWDQLEKVRSLARVGFTRPPRMKQIHKGFRSDYDKRTVLEDGSTVALILNEPDLWMEEMAEAAE